MDPLTTVVGILIVVGFAKLIAHLNDDKDDKP
jgi:hypothetical protein